MGLVSYAREAAVVKSWLDHEHIATITTNNRTGSVSGWRMLA